LSKSTEVMKLVNNLMKAPEVAATMQEFSKEMTKVQMPVRLRCDHSYSPKDYLSCIKLPVVIFASSFLWCRLV
jgi:hypothetical protein